jgi:PAS domain S-box-containing protein
MEEQLRAARKDLEITVQKQQGIIFKFREENGRFIHTLCDGELLYRLQFSPEQIVGRSLEQFLPRELSDQLTQTYRRAWSGEPDITFEHNWNGVWLLGTLRPVLRGGKVIEVIGNYADITERKRVEEEFRESEERYRQLVEMSPDIILVHDCGEILFVNQAGLKAASDLNPDSIIGNRSALSFLTVEEQEASSERVLRIMNGAQPLPDERKITDTNGKNRFYEVTSVPVLFKGRTLIQTIARDVTARRRQERKLRRLDKQFRLIAENMSDLITMFDADWTIKYVSPSHEQVIGYAPDELMNSDIAFSLVHPDDAARVENIFSEMATAKSPRQVEFRYKHKSGRWVYVEAKGTPVLKKNGEIDHIIIVSRDVTERRMAEDSLRKSEALAVVGQLASGIAHEIRNPLASIKGFVQLIKESRTRDDFFMIMNSEFKALEAKIDEFLMLAKPQVARYGTADLSDLAQKVVMLLESQAILRNIQIVFEPDDCPAIIKGDIQQLRQVFVNLLKNAIESMQGGGEIRVRIKHSEADWVTVIIADQGCGINEERLRRIGEPFYSTNENGTGLGLTISHKIVREHEGTIAFRSELNKGTTVEVGFPILKRREK